MGVLDNSNISDHINVGDGGLPSNKQREAQEGTSLLAGKYKDNDALLQGIQAIADKTGVSLESVYKQLESKLGAPAQVGVQEGFREGNQFKQQQAKVVTIEDPKFAESTQRGAFTANEIAELKSLGYTSNMIEIYLSGVQAQQAQQDTAIIDSIGGQEEYNNMLDWVNSTLTPNEHKAFNQVLDKGSLLEKKELIRDLYQDFLRDNGKQPHLLRQRNAQGNVAAGATYNSWAEVTADMKDPRYKTDPSYKMEVATKMSRSTLGNKK